MKQIFIFFLMFPILLFSQKEASKSFTFSLDNIEINTDGLDNIIIENSTSNLIEITLYDANTSTNDIHTKEENKTLKISFENDIVVDENEIFRKFITERLERASAIIKVPKNKNITIVGKTLGITSKSYLGNLSIYIDNGNIRLNKIQGNTFVKFFAGNVFANVSKTNIDVTSNIGKIKIDAILIDEKTYKNQSEKNQESLTIETIKGNIFLMK